MGYAQPNESATRLVLARGETLNTIARCHRMIGMLFVGAVFLAVAPVTVITLPAQAATNCSATSAYNPSAAISVTPPNAAAGTTVVIAGTGWPPNSSI